MTFQFFSGRRAALATMHGKEKIIAPPLFEHLGLQVEVAQVNTDAFGTFTGEIERRGTPLEAARQKCCAAIEQTGLPIGIASEGSFGPHPTVPFVASNHEIVMLLDEELGIQVVGQCLTAETNFAHQVVHSIEEAVAFAEKVGFPSHGLIVRGKSLTKGICDYKLLSEVVSNALATQPSVQLETDMRAMYNPTRQKAIAAAVADLIERLQQLCPACGKPGWGKKNSIPGLPCSWCGLPTSLPVGYLMECPACGYQEEKITTSEQYADPAYCSFCNP
ncbi:MAG: hypothetical protein RMJ44_10220 [Cytophagales bacterium]|nr:hypothetical protein [Bernardetiaceae bacterium]MDW8211452.1 hypothetical protein [Cytophagales bacterium]